CSTWTTWNASAPGDPCSMRPNHRPSPISTWRRGAASRCAISKLELAEGFARLWEIPDILPEIRELLALLDDRADHLTHPLEIDVPLRVHASYTLDEILAALGRHVPGERYPRLQSGVLFDEPTQCDVFFVTTTKSERDYSPTTMYRDYAISPELFHWESQSA